MNNILKELVTIDSSSTKAVAVPAKNRSMARPVTYKVLYAAKDGFAIRRTTNTSIKTLVYSTDLTENNPCIRIEKPGNSIKPITKAGLQSFFKDYFGPGRYGIDITDNNGKTCPWMPTITIFDCPETIKKLMLAAQLIKNRLGIYLKYDLIDLDTAVTALDGITFAPGDIGKNLTVVTKAVSFTAVKNVFNHVVRTFGYKRATVKRYFTHAFFPGGTYMNAKRLEYNKIIQMFETLFSWTAPWNGNNCRPYAYITKTYGAGSVYKLIDSFAESMLETFPSAYDLMLIFYRTMPNGKYADTVKLDIDMVSDYMFKGCVRQGCGSRIEFWQTWRKYLDTQIKLFGNCSDPYPDDLYSSYAKLEYMLRVYNRIYDRFTSSTQTQKIFDAMAQHETVGGYSFSCPRRVIDICSDAVEMGYDLCQHSITELICDGTYMIYFIRITKDPDAERATIIVDCHGNVIHRVTDKAAAADKNLTPAINAWLKHEFKNNK